MSKENRVQVTCPSCQASLVVDPKTGLVLHSEEKKSGYSFESALEDVQRQKGRIEETFRKAFSDERARHQAMEDKFREALESQDELDEPPPKPWDFD